MNKTKYVALIFITVLFACVHKFTIDSSVVTTTSNCNVDTVYFVNEVLPILNSNCAMSGCHNSTSHKEGVILDSYSNIMNTVEVVKGNATESELYKIMTTTSGKIMPPNGKLPDNDLAKIQKWINQGAKNNYCAECDTTQEIKYSVQITSIINSSCKGCHNVNSAGGGINLDNYNDVKTYVDNGRFLGSIQHLSGYSPMPQGQNMLDDCKINQIKKWINNGAQNN